MNRQGAMGMARELTYKFLEHQELKASSVSTDREGGKDLADQVIGFHETLVAYFEKLPD